MICDKILFVIFQVSAQLEPYTIKNIFYLYCIMEFTDLEKERLQFKISSEGGLEQYIKYGIGSKLYSKYKKEFDNLEVYENGYNKNKFYKLLNNLENLIIIYLSDRKTNRQYTDEKLNSVNYIFD